MDLLPEKIMLCFFRQILNNEWYFVLLMGLLSRGLIVTTMIGIAPLIHIDSGDGSINFGWEVFSAWDSILFNKSQLIVMIQQDLNLVQILLFSLYFLY